MSDLDITKTVNGLPDNPKEAYEAVSARLGDKNSMTAEVDGVKFYIERTPAGWSWGDDEISVYLLGGEKNKLLLTFTRDNTFWTSYEAERMKCVEHRSIRCSAPVLETTEEDEETGELTDRYSGGGGLEIGYDVEEEFINFVLWNSISQEYRSEYISECDWLDLMVLRALAATFDRQVIEEQKPHVYYDGD